MVGLARGAHDPRAECLVAGNGGLTAARRCVLGGVPNKVSHHCPSSLLIVDTSQIEAPA